MPGRFYLMLVLLLSWQAPLAVSYAAAAQCSTVRDSSRLCCLRREQICTCLAYSSRVSVVA